MDATLAEGPVFNFKIIGHQWYWSYDYFALLYGGDSLTGEAETVFDSYMVTEDEFLENYGSRLLEVDNSLLLPTLGNIHLLITSADVLHAWAVPSFGVKVDAIPGRINHICFLIKREGSFYGQCSEICGVNHGFMPIKVEGVPLNDIPLFQFQGEEVEEPIKSTSLPELVPNLANPREGVNGGNSTNGWSLSKEEVAEILIISISVGFGVGAVGAVCFVVVAKVVSVVAGY
jgi:heme/copper-type cytochrome/quinol oxidase subunit 2